MIIGQQKIRSYILCAALCIVHILLISRLYYMQIIDHNFYLDLSQKQTSILVSQYPPRGEIFDRNGVLLATNTDCISAFIIPKQLTQTDLTELQNNGFLDKEISHKKSNFLYLARHITQDQKQFFEKNPKIHFLYEKGRYYPHKSCISCIGITNIDNQGIAGIEYFFNQQLQGDPTDYIIQKDARKDSFYAKKEVVAQGHLPQPITVTLDSTLQFLVEEILQQKMSEWDCNQGAAIIADPQTGEILALVSCSPHVFEKNNIHNYGVTHAYEFGSVNKVFLALAALDEKIVDSNTLIDCKNTTTTILDGRPINTWKAHGTIPFSSVIAQSNNIGVAIVAKKLDEKLYHHYIKLGFGKKPSIELPAAAKGFVNHPSNWSKQSIISLSYGYEIAASLLQLTQAFCIIAHDGIAVPLSLIKDNCKKKKKQKYASDTIKSIKTILEETTQQGTAYRARMKGYRVMTKTGSAHLLVNGQYSQDSNIYSCAGIIEKDSYQRVITLCVKKEGAGQKKLWASVIAVPIFQTIAEKMLVHERII